jgi:hypothetical protein
MAATIAEHAVLAFRFFVAEVICPNVGAVCRRLVIGSVGCRPAAPRLVVGLFNRLRLDLPNEFDDLKLPGR